MCKYVCACTTNAVPMCAHTCFVQMSSMFRIKYLDQEIVTLQEQLNGLQIQKDKALADLSAIRKTNKDIERFVPHIAIFRSY